MSKNKQIISQRDQIQISSSSLVDLSTLSEAAFNEEVERGYVYMQAGRTKNAEIVFASIRKDYGI